MTKNIKRLTLGSDKKLAGVCSGIAEYFEADPTLIRLLWVFVSLISGVLPGVLAYFIFAVVMPKN